MALVLVATVGATNANSYISRAGADTYFEGRFGTSAWTSASNGDKEIALVQATRTIDRYHRFHGEKNASTQALSFPRDIQEEAVTALPQCVMDACCEQALWALQNKDRGGLSQRQQLQGEGVKSFGVGDLREEYARAGRRGLCPEAEDLLEGWIDRTGQIYGEREAPGERAWWPFEP